jgi:Holliday junction resolvase
MNAGAGLETAKKVLSRIKPKLHNNITTRKIYSLAFKELRKVDNPTASRYEVKWAVIRLGRGQQGFSFEQYVGNLFKRMGYKTKLNQIVRGKSGITHEIDVIAIKGKEKLMIECKHLSKPGIWINIQAPLYVYARFLDLSNKFTGVALVTNSRFSVQSETYAKSVDMKLMSWNYPIGNSLRELADIYAVYPITVLRTVDNDVLQELLSRDIVTVAEILLLSANNLAKLVGRQKAVAIRAEAEKLVLTHD